jgi:hypothetical protein
MDMIQKTINISKNQPQMKPKSDIIINLKEEGTKTIVLMRYLEQIKQLLCSFLKEQARLNHLFHKLLYLLIKVLNSILVNKKCMM